MSRKYLSKEEALALFSELPSDDESVISNGSTSDEEYVQPPDFSSNDEDILDEEEHDDMTSSSVSRPSPSRSSEITWVAKGATKTVLPDFCAEAGPSDDILSLEEKTPISLFLALFTSVLMQEIVFQTNLYSTQEGKQFTPLTLEELYRFLAINLLMGIKRMPSYRDYWSSFEDLHDNYISKQMSVKRFSWILSHLHLNDNSMKPKYGEKNYDKLFKVRPFLSTLGETFLSAIKPGQNQAIDESMIKFKGRSSIKQYMPKKPIKRGYKVWMRCEESGYASQFEIYTGKVDKIVQKNLGESVVMSLSKPLFGRNHRLFMDNFFTSYNLFKFLGTQNIFACGTVNMSRKNLPKNLSDDKNLKRGQFDWAVSNDNIVCLKWKDKRCVNILSTLENPVEINAVERKERDGSKISVSCPKAVLDYNKHMGFVDHFDHLISLYAIDRKSRKWWHRIFFHFLDASVVNSFILYKMVNNGNIEIKTMKDFRREIVRSLVEMGAKPGLERKRPSTSGIKAIKKHKPFIPDEIKYKNVEHLPVKCTRRRCAHCSTRDKPHQTRTMCETCNVGLCMQTKDISCFVKFHKK